MKFSDKISMAFKDLMNRKLRSMLTIIAVSIGCLLLIVMMGLGDGIINKLKETMSGFGETNVIQVYPIDEQKIKDGNSYESDIKVSDVGDESESSTEEDSNENSVEKKITQEDLNAIKDINGVEKIEAYAQGNVTGVVVDNDKKLNNKITLYGYDFSNDVDISDKLATGSILKNEDSDVIVTEDIVSKLGLNNDDILNKTIKVQVEYPEMNGIKIKEEKFVEGTVVGVVSKDKVTNTIMMSEKKADSLLAYFTDKDEYLSQKGYSSVNVYAEEGENLTSLANKISNESGYYTFTTDMINKSVDVMGVIVKAILSIGGLIVLIVAALGLVNTVSMTLQEKRKMIGVMRSIGGSRGNIRTIFTFQSFIIGLFGGILGIIISAIGIVIANNSIKNFTIPLTTNNALIALVITLVISVIAGIIPASKAARINVVEAVAEE